ncbi:hypothetical protein HNQ51_000529 [Inhella inkyongensis]|uniref:Uncharacterized protein n=1 Tax=Inhella inkyongensis TaxID=392593 RepID=A0A840S2B9_9BURK|nr:hypothetical protein [Inhella inkyongensis]MBB5203236.1 hypothetical protein [Inhella inkyongensis]
MASQLAQLLAALGLLICLLLAVHMLLGPAKQQRLNQAWDRWMARLSAESRAERRRRERAESAQRLQQAQERARSRPIPLDEVEWEGNVARPNFGSRSKRQVH